MFKGRSKTRFRGRVESKDVQKVPLKGLFTDGVWHCNCEPRLPAQHFKVKNGGKNHGRWFYTCQKPQTTRCNFYLWDDEAKGREAAVVLNNSRSEPESEPQQPSQTPTRLNYGNGNGHMTPQTGNRLRMRSPETITPYTLSKPSTFNRFAARATPTVRATSNTIAEQDDSPEEFYDWPQSDEEEMSKAADQASSQSQNAMLPPETPRKAIKTESFSTPGKRRFDEMDNGSAAAWPTPVSERKGDDVFSTPATVVGSKNLFSSSEPPETPTPVRFNDIAPTATADSSLATEVLKALKTAEVTLASHTRNEIRDICNRQSLFTHGVMKGRDISRSLISKKDEKITELQGSIEALQSERETSRAVIRHLRRQLGVTKNTDG